MADAWIKSVVEFDNCYLYVAFDLGNTAAEWCRNYRDIYFHHPHSRDVIFPTTLLLDPDGNLEAYGLEAVARYNGTEHGRELHYPERHKDYYLFDNVKTCLYDEEVGL